LTPISTISVTDGNRAISNLNELEYINGEIWANIWMTDRIVRINPTTGKVTYTLDLGALPRQLRADVLNGIAYDQQNSRLFVTGKLWANLYEIKACENFLSTSGGQQATASSQSTNNPTTTVGIEFIGRGSQISGQPQMQLIYLICGVGLVLYLSVKFLLRQ
jgi:hypothetical protein